MPSRETIRRWALGNNSPLTGKNLFVAKPSEELSFFLGAWLGDGWADENDGGKRLLLKVRSHDFAMEFAEAATKVLQKTDSYWVRRVVDRNGKWFLVKVTSFQLYEFVNQSIEQLQAVIEPFPGGFLRGIYTAEGNPEVSLQHRAQTRLEIGICVSNSDFRMLGIVRNILIGLTYHPGRIRLNTAAGSRTNLGVARRDNWMMNLCRFAEVKRFASEIGFADSEKRGKLIDAIGIIEKLGHVRGAREWAARYVKKSGYWTRRDDPTSASW